MRQEHRTESRPLALLQALDSATRSVEGEGGMANGAGLLQSALRFVAPRISAAMLRGPFGIGQATAAPAEPQTMS